MSSLHMAILTGHAETAMEIIDDKKSEVSAKISMKFINFINKQDEDGNTPLHLAVELDNVELAEFLITNGAVMSIRNYSNISPYALAIDEDNIYMIEMFEKYLN